MLKAIFAVLLLPLRLLAVLNEVESLPLLGITAEEQEVWDRTVDCLRKCTTVPSIYKDLPIQDKKDFQEKFRLCHKSCNSHKLQEIQQKMVGAGQATAKRAAANMAARRAGRMNHSRHTVKLSTAEAAVDAKYKQCEKTCMDEYRAGQDKHVATNAVCISFCSEKYQEIKPIMKKRAFAAHPEFRRKKEQFAAAKRAKEKFGTVIATSKSALAAHEASGADKLMLTMEEVAAQNAYEQCERECLGSSRGKNVHKMTEEEKEQRFAKYTMCRTECTELHPEYRKVMRKRSVAAHPEYKKALHPSHSKVVKSTGRHSDL